MGLINIIGNTIYSGLILGGLPQCVDGIAVAWYKNLLNPTTTGIDPSDSFEYYAIKDEIGDRQDTVFHGQYLSSGSINFHRAVQIDYTDPSDGSFVEGLDVPTGVLVVPANGICNIGAYPRSSAIDGVIDFDGIDDYVNSSGDYVVPDNGFIEFNTYLDKESGYLTTNNIGQLLISFGRHASSGGDSYVSLSGSNLQFWIANTNQIYTYPLSGLSNTELLLRFEWVGGVLTTFSINGTTQTPVTGTGGVFGSAFINVGGLLGNYFLSDAYVWNVNINDDHVYNGRPDGNLDSAWLDVAPDMNKCFTNAGCSGTTDWVDSNSDGLGDNFTALQEGGYSIVTGNGFTGNAQRAEYVTARGDILSDTVSVTNGNEYQIKFKYRGFSSTFGPILYIRNGSGGALGTHILTNNTSDAIEYISPAFTANTSEVDLRFYNNNNSIVGNWFEIDEIELLSTSALDGTVNGSPTTIALGETQDDYSYTSYYPTHERAGTVLHDVMKESLHSSITTPVWGETLYGNDDLNQIGFVDKEASDAKSLPWETVVNGSAVTLDDNTLVPLSKWGWVNLQDLNGNNILDSNGDQLQVKQNI